MKLVAVSRVKNEIDIIEAFVRHTAFHFDKLILLDDGSSDGTYEALLSLQAAGLPLVVLREPSVGYEQSRYMTRLLCMAVNQFGADWVAPLDADEFIEPPPGMTLAQILTPRPPRTPLTMAWNSFIWRPRDDEDPEPNPVLRLRFRLPAQPRHSLGKVLAPAALVAEGRVELWPGNHGLSRDGQELPSQPLESVNLCHFPIRGVGQYAGKVAVGYLQYCAMPHWDRAIGWHYLEPFRLLAGGLDPLMQTMEATSRRYSMEETEPACGEAFCAPLRYVGGALTLTGGRLDPLANILQCAESIALQRAESVARHEALASDLAKATPDLADTPPLQRIAALQTAAETMAQAAEQVRRELLSANQAHQALELQSRGLQRRLAALEHELTELHQVVRAQTGQLSSRTFRLARRLHRAVVRTGLPISAVADRCARLIRGLR